MAWQEVAKKAQDMQPSKAIIHWRRQASGVSAILAVAPEPHRLKGAAMDNNRISDCQLDF